MALPNLLCAHRRGHHQFLCTTDGARAGLDRVLRTLDRVRGQSPQRQAEALTTETLAGASGRMADDMTTFVLKRP